MWVHRARLALLGRVKKDGSLFSWGSISLFLFFLLERTYEPKHSDSREELLLVVDFDAIDFEAIVACYAVK